jgi:L-alanine-DL-glutamate epimerase-like enolase superfamily enzyme
MKITAIETIQLGEFPNTLHVRIHTDAGVIGLGETRNGAGCVAAWIHESAAAYLLGEDPLAIEKHWRCLNPMLGFNSTGAECRGRSALDIALWDILGQVSGQPLFQLLGGRVRERNRLYNTCAGPSYAREIPRVNRILTDNWNIAEQGETNPYEDLEGFLLRPADLARSLLDQGISLMKIWPFDPYAEASDGHHISLADLKQGLEPFRKIREAVGDAMEIMVELHSLWDLPSAVKIASAIEEYHPYWFEDPLRMDDLGALAEFSGRFRIPTAAGETVGTRWTYREILERRAAGILLVDPCYAGGISETRKIAAMAETYQRPVALHDCVGPVNFILNTHLSVHFPNAFVQEFARAFYYGWYKELVSTVPSIDNGFVSPLDGPGLGAQLRPEVFERADLSRRISGRET